MRIVFRPWLRHAAACLLAVTLSLPAQAGATQAGQWTINMKDTDIRDFIGAVSSITGDTLVVDPRVTGQVSVMATEAMSLPEVRRLFLSVMTVNGYAVIEDDQQTRIVPNDEAHGWAGTGRSGNDAIETRVLAVQHGVASELLPMLRPLLPANAHLAAVPTSNSLIISDRRGNIARIQTLLRQLDAPVLHEHSAYDAVHASAESLQRMLTATLGASAASGGTRVLADARLNRLLVFGPVQARERLIALARSLDADAPQSSTTQVMRLRHGDAKQIAQTVDAIAGSINADPQQGQSKASSLVRADESI
ncbi:MAG: secretin N-terminal domain-containing protein, partial [Stenotrophomonas sp.]